MFWPDMSQYLNAGGLGILALLCLVVLGHNAWSLNGLVKKAEPRRITAARPLLLAQMALSFVGMLGLGLGAIYLGQLEMEDNRVRTTIVTLDPRGEDVDRRYRPVITAPEGTQLAGSWTIDCRPGQRPARVDINFGPYIQYRVQNSVRNRAIGLTGAGG